MNSDLQKHFYSLLNSRYNRCLEPSLQCPNKAIRAHSIQNSRVLDLICCNDHVIQLLPHFEKDNPSELRYKLIGRNKATTFTGLCSEHDRTIFREVDNNQINANDTLHLFLLAYRSIYRELYATMDAAVVSQSGYMKRVELGLDPQDEPSRAGIEAINQMLVSWRTYRYKCIFDEINANSEYSRLRSFIQIIDIEQPTIAASLFFCIRPHTSLDDIEGVTLNIVPIESTKTLVVMSYLEEHEQLAKTGFYQLFNAEGDYFKYLLSKLLIKHGENFVINPAYYDRWCQDKRTIICRLYAKTLFDDVYDEDSEHLNLFQ